MVTPPAIPCCAACAGFHIPGGVCPQPICIPAQCWGVGAWPPQGWVCPHCGADPLPKAVCWFPPPGEPLPPKATCCVGELPPI